MKPHHVDVAIIGSGFSGTILARVLHRRGRRVALVDAAAHPRFAIGESSTPIADLMLRRIGQQEALPDLVALSAYGSWQRLHPNLGCGLKRGFSYFDHRPRGQLPRESAMGQRSLLVAASPNDQRSDTHWYRSDVDAFLFRQATAEGVATWEGQAVVGMKRDPRERWHLSLENGVSVTAEWVVDASGNAAVTPRLLGQRPLTRRLRTRTCAALAHYRGVTGFSDRFNALHGDRRGATPFDADAAAQHHLIEGGWIWMLRMNPGVTSVGVVLPLAVEDTAGRQQPSTAVRLLEQRLADYPGLHPVLADAEPDAATPKPRRIDRIQNLWDPWVAPGCVLLPTTALTLDPLHSTGIAHALLGVHRLASALTGPRRDAALATYRHAIFAEAELLDRLVRLAYDLMPCFPRFTAACMLYFAAAITCEERIQSGEVPSRGWQADEANFLRAAHESELALRTCRDDSTAIDRVRRLVEPWNHAGLLDDRVGNRYAYTGTK